MKKVLIALAASTLALGLASTAHADADYGDATGDGSGAPDIGRVSVLNDAFGKVSFVLALADGNELQADGEIAVVIDSDRDPATGTAGGWDHVLSVNGANRSWSLAFWNGSAFADAPSSTVEVRMVKGFAMLSVNRSELGNSGSFDFFVLSGKFTGEEMVASDVAPDGSDYWSYSVVSKQLTLVAGPVVRVPKIAKAGKPFGVGFTVVRSDSPEGITDARVTCRATLAGKPVAVRSGFVGPAGEIAAGVAACQLTLPASAKGKSLQIRVTVTYLGSSTTKTVTVKVL